MRRHRTTTNRNNATTPAASALCAAAWLFCCYAALCSIPTSSAADAVESSIIPRQQSLEDDSFVAVVVEFSKFKLQPRQSLKGEAAAATASASNQQQQQQSRILKGDSQALEEPAEQQQEQQQEQQLVLKRHPGYQRSNPQNNRQRQRRGNPPGINKRRNNGGGYNNNNNNNNNNRNNWNGNGGKPSGQARNNNNSAWWNNSGNKKLCPCPSSWESTNKWWGGRTLLNGGGGFFWRGGNNGSRGGGGGRGYNSYYGSEGSKVNRNNKDRAWWGGSTTSNNNAWWSSWGGTNGWGASNNWGTSNGWGTSNSGRASNSWGTSNGWGASSNGWNTRSSWGMKWCPCPTYPPTEHPTEQPTYPPPPPRITTYPPSQSPTTLSPTSEMPSERPSNPPDFESCEWFFWGADEARGGILDDNQKVPYLYKWPTVIDLSSGSRHIFIIDQKGIAQVAGFVESKTAYRGHLGIKNWVQGSNGFTTIDEVVVYDNGTIPETVPAPRFIRVFAGAGTPGDARAMHSILISEDGEVFTMGNNDRGQLCLGDQDHRFIPHNVPDLPGPAVAASVGLDFTLILLEDGQVFGCGSNQNGEIGLGQKIHHSFFATQINIGNTTGIVDVSTGWAFSLFQDAAGLVFGTGSNLFSQMCKTTEGDPIFEPELIQGVTDVQQIFAGSESSYFLQEDGSVKACGRNDQGQLGDGSFFQRSKPVNVKIPKGEKIRLIGSGPSAVSVFFVGEDLGLMFAAGINDRFQLGLGVNGGNVAAESVPTEVDFGEDAEMFNFTKVSASGTNTAAIACMLDAPTTSPTAYPTDHPTANPTMFPTEYPTKEPTFEPTGEPTGEPTSEPTGEPTENPTLYPTMNPTIITDEPTEEPTMYPTLNPTTAAPGWWFWGADEGQGGSMGDNQKVPIFYEEVVIDLSAGSRHSFLIDKDGNAFAAGFIESEFSYKGHLGVDDYEEGKNTGKQIDVVFDLDGEKVDAPKFKKAYAGAGVPSDSGEMHSMLIDEDGHVYTSGRNSKGQLCLGDRKDRFEFSQVGGLPKPAIAGTMGFEFTFILLEDGTVWGCGSNEFGELGLGPTVDFTDEPDNGNGLKGIKDLASGYKHTVFLDDDNVVYGTGGNIYGQQCYFTEGEPATVPTPDILASVKGTVVQVEANRESSYYLFQDGSAVSCGRNDEGQLGDGTFVNTSKDKPIVNVKLKEKIRKIGSGPSAQSVFFVTDDSVYGAGLNDRFQLGINKIGSEEFPVKVEFDGDVEIDVISASGTHSVAAGRYL